VKGKAGLFDVGIKVAVSRRAGVPAVLPLGVLALLFAWLLPAAGQPAGSEADKEARRIFTTVMSPYCPGQLLADCTSSAAAVLRDSIKAQLNRGRPAGEIIDELAATFGRQILALPPNQGLGRLAWLGPMAALLASLLILFWWFRQRRSPPAAEPAGRPAPAGPGPDPGLRRRLEEELERFDR
jgi:cytochrome c-type biogenesis protein CcmH/NrfF